MLARLLGEALPFTTDPVFEMRFAALGLPATEIEDSLDLGDAVLAGGGGVANGFLWGLESLNPIGKLAIVDPKRARSGNANRCLFFDADDKEFKATLLAERVTLPGVEIEPFVGVLHDYVATRIDKRLPTLISTADSREVRRSFQKELPLRVFDASTTDVSEVVVHAHEQPTGHACLSCIYPHVEDEDHRARHVAGSLGLSLEEVQAGFITAEVAAKLATSFPTLGTGEALINTAFDTLQKALCGEGLLKPAPGAEQAAAPFSFVSNLAGLLLALEMYRYQTDRAGWSRTNYLVVSPWKAPHQMVRRLRARLATCEFCADPISTATLRAVWADVIA
ncbi:MAG: hypothetical protein ACTHJR_17515 [Sphingomonas sp.]|uniref:hypothetical protein n=1 Tax=Sphingomonas sp. TaxID=28214 RepID=UPI003F803905